ncbi:LOW QUALITY PROTEIN: uncharacterized protein EMH_0070730 [Eimeria mitis]|uniref:Uncharacterized protein n=1 Tax=Eimeria mitis TaxID=44415 RepID=U6K2L2_9EIME|nr:LOW QUALITY PROTEIN: uncharacterized protein EMH_0070730 [Eimeria mitis]CDJ31899.1 hypothetical protein EMH_0070730 [Eimeria mitis]
MIKLCCAGVALLAVTAGTASLEAHERKPNSFLSLGTHQSETLTYNKAAGDTRSKRTILNSRPHEFGDDLEASDLSSTDAQAETENSPRGFTELYATLHADAYGIRPAGEVPDSLQAEEEDEFGEEASSSRVASLAQLQAKSPRGSGQKGPERQTSGAMSVLRALSRPIMAVGSAAMKATRELRKFLSSPKMSLEDTKIGGKGSPVVAKALSRLGRVRSTAFLRKVDEELDLFLPRDEEIGYDCVDARQKIVLRRGFPLGAGTFGFVVPFTSNHGAKYAGKLFQVRHGEKATMNNVRKQLSILTYLPPGVDAARASHTLRLGLPLCVVTKRSSPSVMELPTRGTLLNAIVLYPLLRAESWSCPLEGHF